MDVSYGEMFLISISMVLVNVMMFGIRPSNKYWRKNDALNVYELCYMFSQELTSSLKICK